MIKDKPQRGVIRLGFFYPSSFDDCDYISSVLDKKISDIESIAYLRYKRDIVGDYCVSRGVSAFSVAINGTYPLPYAINRIVEFSDYICILDNGSSKSVPLVIESCEAKSKPYKKIPVDPTFSNKDLLLYLKECIEHGGGDSVMVDNDFIKTFVKSYGK
jgi:hypothetical protein